MNQWSFSAPPSAVAFGAGVWLLSAWFCWQSWRRRGGGAKMAGLETLRLVIITLLGVTLLRPEIVQRTVLTEKPVVVVLCDGSASMTTRDLPLGPTNIVRRADWIQEQKLRRAWMSLDKSAKVIVEDFAAPPGSNDVVAADTEEGTDLDLALENVLSQHRQLKAVLVLSDGDWNLGKSPVTAATQFRALNVPIYTVGVGSEIPLPDLVVQSVAAPSYGLLGEQIAIPYKIQNHLPRDVKTSVALMGSKGVEATKQITLPAGATFADAIVWSPRAIGDHDLTLVLPVEKDESLTDNNELPMRISVRTEKLNVLVVESRPRWEYRFLRNALARDPGVDLHCLLLHPGQAPGGGSNYIRSFPNTKEQLAGYDVIFLGDVGIGGGELTDADAELIKGLVEQQGSGVVFLPGPRGRQLSLQASPLRDLMPVVLDESAAASIRLADEAHLLLTTEGRGHFLTMLAPDDLANEALWKTLPGFFWCAAVLKTRPGASVLAVHSTMRNEWGRLPLLVTQPCGNGKSLFMGTDSAWRWRIGVEDKYHYRFWGQVVRWMAHQRHLAQGQGMRLIYSPEDPHVGDTVFLQATVLDASGYPLEKGNVTAKVQSPASPAERLDFAAVTGGWGVFKSSFAPQRSGRYKVTLTSETPPREMEVEITVTKPKREKLGQPANIAALRELAEITRGSYGNVQDLDRLVSQLAQLPAPQPIEKRFRLWCDPWWGGALFTLLVIYWTARKLAGMV